MKDYDTSFRILEEPLMIVGIGVAFAKEDERWKKVFLIFGMCDEVFSINCTVNPPEDVDKGWFMLFVGLCAFRVMEGGDQ